LTTSSREGVTGNAFFPPNAQVRQPGLPDGLHTSEDRDAGPACCNDSFGPAQRRFQVVPFAQLIVLPSLVSSPTRPSSQPSPLRTTNFVASVIRPVANSPFSLTRSKTRPRWKTAQGWASWPSYSHSPGNLLALSGSAAPARPPSTSSPPAAATAFTMSRRISFSVIEHLLSARADGTRGHGSATTAVASQRGASPSRTESRYTSVARPVKAPRLRDVTLPRAFAARPSSGAPPSTSRGGGG